MELTNHLTLPASAGLTGLSNGSVLFIGNATVLIRYAGFTILTDPTFIHMHEQVSIGYGMHSTRLTNPAMEISDLPPLDLIILSHFHGDHFDQVAERELDRSLPIVTVGEAAKELNDRGFKNTYALETWAPVLVEKGEATLRITSTPGRHGPPLSQLVMPEVMGSMLEFQ
jgi:L-ascorbate metabolism protein UlaG (beta-lactamase superfamily)